MFQIAKLKSIPDGYMNYSLKAIRSMLPHLETGMNLHEARIKAGYEKRAADAIGYLAPIDPEHFRNPVVSRALSETRKVVNALIREHGLPARITVEMARETKGSIPERAKKNIENLRRKAENDRVHDEIARYYGDDRKVTHDDIEKYKLWEECNRQLPIYWRFHRDASSLWRQLSLRHRTYPPLPAKP